MDNNKALNITTTLSKLSNNEKLKKIMEIFNEEFTEACRRSREAEIRRLPTGAKIPEEGKIYDMSIMVEIDELRRFLNEQVAIVINDVIANIKKKMTDAPSTEAVNTIALLKLRKSVTRTEIEDLLARYGDNYQAYKAIKSIASEKDIIIWDSQSDFDTFEEDMRTLKKNIDTYLSGTEDRTNDAYKSIVKAFIDQRITD